MNRIFILLLFFTLIFNLGFSQEGLAQEYYDKLISNEEVESIESVSQRDSGIIVKGLVYDRVRLDTVYVKSNNEGMDEIVLLISDLEEAFLRKNKDIRSISINATEDSLVAKGKVDVLGGTFDVVLEGIFRINNNNVFYDIRKAKIGVLSVPQWIINNFKKKINPFFEVDDLDIDLKLSKMIFQEDKILVR